MFRIDHATAAVGLPAPDVLGTPGYFIKGNPGGGIAATVVTADWANATQEELMYVIEQAGLAASKVDRTLLRQAIALQIATALATNAPGSPTAAIGLKRVMHAPVQGTWVNSGPTFNVQTNPYALFDLTANNGHVISDTSKFGAVNYYNSIAASGSAGTYTYEYWNGAAWTALAMLATPTWTTVGYQQMRFTIPGGWAVGGSGTNVPAGSFNIRLRATIAPGTTGVTGIASLSGGYDTTTTETVLADASDNKKRKLNTSTKPNINNSGANGLDTGVPAANAWYFEHQIYNPSTLTLAGLYSTSPTAPTMPSGYTMSKLVGSGFLDANKNFVPTRQDECDVQYLSGPIPLMASGNTGSVVTAVGLANFVPLLTASRVRGLSQANASAAGIGVHPDNMAIWNSVTNPMFSFWVPPSATNVSMQFDFSINGSNIYWSSSAAALLWCTGWRENI